MRHIFSLSLALALGFLTAAFPLGAQTIYTPYRFVTIAGTPGASGSTDGVGAAARFNLPLALAVDTSGNIYVTDTANDTIRKIVPTVSGGVTTWTVSTLAGTAGVDGTVDGTGRGALFDSPDGIYAAPDGSVWVDSNISRGVGLFNASTATYYDVRMITSGGTVTTMTAYTQSTNGYSYGQLGSANSVPLPTELPPLTPQLQFYLALPFEGTAPNGDAFEIDYVDGGVGTPTSPAVAEFLQQPTAQNNTSVLFYVVNGGPGSKDGQSPNTSCNSPQGMAIDGSNNVYVADTLNHLIRKASLTVTNGAESWNVTTLGGVAGSSGSSDGLGSAARFNNPCAVAVSSSGVIYIADTYNDTIRMGTPDVAPVASNAGVQAIMGQVSTFTLPATDAGGSALTYSITGTTGGSATLSGNQATFTPTGAGAGSITFTASDGYLSSNTGTLTINTILPQPAITLQASSQTVATGRTAVFNALATGFPAPTYQWTLNGSTTIPGASTTTDPILMIAGATAADVGAYVCTASNNLGTASTSANLAVATTANPGYLNNLSGRGMIGVGAANGLFPGFNITGAGTKLLLLRADGPRLAAPNFNLSDAIATPSFTVFDSSTASIVTDSGWGNTLQPGNSSDHVDPQQATASFMLSLGAFSLPTGSADCAVQITAGVGAYTAEETGLNGSSGIGLVEIYDADSSPPTARLNNLAVRAPVGTGDGIIIAGFVVGGTTGETVLVRGVGPRLESGPFNLGGVLAQPVLTIYSGATPICSNTGWGDDPVLADAMSIVGAYSYATGSADSAVLVTLPPGAYTAEVSGLNSTTGIASVEIYEVE